MCGKKEVADFATLQFHQVVALWLILGGAVVLAAVSFIFHFIFAKCFRRYAKRKGLIPNSNMKTPNTAAGTSHKSLAVDSVPIGGYETKTRASPSSWACSPTGQGLGPQGAVYGQGDGRAALEPRMLSMVQEGVEGSVTEGSAPGGSMCGY